MEQLAPQPAFTSRQKSCHACVKGKRGCDKRHPVCSRCEEKNIQCVYAKRTYGEAFHDFNSELDMSWADPGALFPSVDFIDNIPSSLTPSASLDSTHLTTFDESINPFLAFTENQAMPPSNAQLLNSTGEPLGQQQEKAHIRSNFDYAPTAELCIQYEPWQIYDSNSKVHFIVRCLKSYPITFTKDTSTPWMHRHLYKNQMPSSIQSCFTVSALYRSITSSNKSSVFRVFYENLEELTQHQLATTPQEKLARAQALFLYQILCLFDGDVTLRSNADRNMPLLQEWLNELCKIRENIGTPESMSDVRPPRSWEWWIFSESVHRTITIIYCFLGLWSIMCKTNKEDVFFDARKSSHCWTVSRPLWEAPSSFDFFRAWKAYPVVENFEFENFLRTGKADDVDDFSKVIMVSWVLSFAKMKPSADTLSYMGLDETKQWFMERDGIF